MLLGVAAVGCCVLVCCCVLCVSLTHRAAKRREAAEREGAAVPGVPLPDDALVGQHGLSVFALSRRRRRDWFEFLLHLGSPLPGLQKEAAFNFLARLVSGPRFH